MVLLVIKLLINLQQFQENHNKIADRQLQMSMIRKYLKEDIYHQKEDRKLFMI